MSPFAGWQNFYVIIGSSAGALIGLQFVVITLIANIGHGDVAAGRAFTTPTIVHLGVTLLLAAASTVPWCGTVVLRAVWAVVGASGFVYVATVMQCMRRQTAYRPQLEDWVFHVALPAMGYAVFAIASWVPATQIRESLIAVAGATLLLLFVGIHNAWDAVTYHVFTEVGRFPIDFALIRCASAPAPASDPQSR